MGASAAFHLAEAGVSVVLLERDELASGSTSRAAGGVRANFSDELNISLGKRSLELFADFPQRPGQEIDLHRSGYLFILTRPDDVDLFTASVALQNSLGVESRMIDVEEACRLSPLLDPEGVLAAAWSPNDGHCTPESVVQGYASGARRHGAVVRTGVEVTGIDSSGGEITAVHSTDGSIQTGCVIDCAGAWSPQIAAYVGINLPVTPYKRELLVTEPMPEPIEMAFTIDYATTFYWHREGPGILTGFSRKDVDPGFDISRDADFPERLAELAAVRAPALLDLGVRSGWAGLYEVTPDHNALLGESKDVSRFLYATGFSGHGFLQGPAIGEILRDMYLGVTPFIDVSPLDVERFASGELRPERNIV
ncbi:MAG: sarcosine oxidase subunit beta [Actinomycetales bacterium mxb001]|nr:MAG: sarcosine oxidase subunit beta [Actinomycetales bacterium mxb001]